MAVLGKIIEHYNGQEYEKKNDFSVQSGLNF